MSTREKRDTDSIEVLFDAKKIWSELEEYGFDRSIPSEGTGVPKPIAEEQVVPYTALFYCERVLDFIPSEHPIFWFSLEGESKKLAFRKCLPECPVGHAVRSFLLDTPIAKDLATIYFEKGDGSLRLSFKPEDGSEAFTYVLLASDFVPEQAEDFVETQYLPAKKEHGDADVWVLENCIEKQRTLWDIFQGKRAADKANYYSLVDDLLEGREPLRDEDLLP